MNDNRYRQIRSELERITKIVEDNLYLVFGEISKDWPLSVRFDDTDDLPWVIRIGYVQGQCVVVDGFDVPHLTKQWKEFGVETVRETLVEVQS